MTAIDTTMDTIRWDAMAALIALIGLPFMLSGGATWLIMFTINRIQRYVLAHGSTCERLEWRDIPDGPLHELQGQGLFELHNPPEFEHSDKDCFTSTLGRAFQYAWISAQRRNQRVFKPYQLDPRKRYVRTDRKTLEAFLLVSCTDTIQFREINGILTAHLPVIDSELRCRWKGLHNRTKHEIEMILQGYPPFYLERIKVTDTTTVLTPISSTVDTTRGGWILGLGIDSLMTPHLGTHNMENGYFPPSHWQFERRSGRKKDWMFTCISSAVRRFEEVLGKVLLLFPEDTVVQDATEIVRRLTSDDYRSASAIFPFLARYEKFSNLMLLFECSYGKLRGQFTFLSLRSELSTSLSFRSELNKDEWELAMSAFNHRGPLEPKEVELLRDKRVPILQAGIFGLLIVFTIDITDEYRRVRNLSELQGRKYIYLTECDPEVEE